MINKKRLLSVAAAVAISSSMVNADYLPLTSSTQENKWVMFGVAGFHADGATTGTATTGATEAGVFRISDATGNVAEDTGDNEFYGEEEGTIADAITSGANILGSVKKVNGAGDVEVRVDVSAIAYQETDPVRTIYVTDETTQTPIFAFSYKSALEGQRLEFSTAGGTSVKYITINSENTYSNPAVGVIIPADDGTGGTDANDGTRLTGLSDIVDYDFSNNPVTSANYLKADHQNVAAANENLRLYSYNPNGIWEIYDSRNTFNDFTDLQKGKGYWGKMDQDGSAGDPGGLVLGSPSITTQDYIDSGIAEGWNLLAFNADNAELRAATTGLIVPIDTVQATTLSLTIGDVSGNHSVAVTTGAGTTVQSLARDINQAIKEAKITGTIPKTMNVVAIPATASIILLSDEKFTFTENDNGLVSGSITTLANLDPLDSTTLDDHAAGAGVYTTNPAMSKYGEYALIVNPENAAFAELDIKCTDVPDGTTHLPTTVGIAGSNCIETATLIDANFDITVDDLILMASDEPFEIRDHTFTRVFEYTARADAGQLTFESADAGITPATVPASQVAVYTLDLTGAAVDDASDSIDFTNGGATTNYVVGAAANATQIATALIAAGTITIDGVVYDITAGGNTETVVFTAQTAVAEADNMVVGVTSNGGAADSAPTATPYLISTPGLESLTAQEVVTSIETEVLNFVDGDNIVVADTTKILFRMKGDEKSEFRVLETGLADNLTPSTTTSPLAKGAISDVFSPNAIVNATLTNSIEIDLADNTDPVVTDTVTVTVITPLGTTTLEDYALDATDEADANIFYAKLTTHINSELNDKGVDTTVAITKANATDDDFSATITFTGTDATDATIAFSDGSPTITAATLAAGTIVLGTPTITNGDITQDLQYNFVLSPNYVLDGPLYEMVAAGFKPLAMVTGTMNLTGNTMGWDGIDLTRKPSEWLKSQDYNLFTVDSAAGYWTYLEPAEENPLSFSVAPFTGEYTQHFDSDGATFNKVSGQIQVTVTGISDFDDRTSARVVAIVGGTEVELSRDGSSDTYTGQISSDEIAGLNPGSEYDIQVVVADGLGNRIPATATGVRVDFKKPSEPALTFVDGSTLTIANDEDEGVTKYYVYNGAIPATNTEAGKLFTITAAEATAGYNICAENLTRTTAYTLNFVALDGDNLASSNASDVFTQSNYMPLFKNSAIVSNTNQGDGSTTTSVADVKYTNGCVVDAAFAGDTSVQASSLTNFETVKVAYVPRVTGDAVAITVHVDGGTENTRVGRITYHPDYINDTVFIQLGERVYSYVLPDETTAVGSTEADPRDLSVDGTYLVGQSLGE